MAVQQGRLDSTDTTKDLEAFYNDIVVNAAKKVDRIIHNGTQFVRLVMRRPKPIRGFRASSSSPNSQVSTPQYVDSLFTANPVTNTNIIVIDFDGVSVSSTQIIIYSTTALNTTSGNWAVAVSSNNTDSQFSNTLFICPLNGSITTVFDVPTGQFKTTVNVSLPPVDPSGNGLPFWRLRHATAGEFNNVTEVQILPPLAKGVLSYFDTDGSFASSFSFEKDNVLDAAYDSVNDVFYTIRFNDDSTGTVSLSPNDDFSEANAGSAASTNAFNPARWTESSSNSQFLRSSEKLVYNVAAGKGQLDTTYQLGGSSLFTTMEVNPISITTRPMWMALRALEATSNNTIMSEGVGMLTSPTTTGVWFSSHISNIVNSTATSQLREMRPLWHNTSSGTDAFTLTYNGADWTVSGTLTGALTNASTGSLYTEAIASTTPLEFVISSTANPTPGEQFTFDLITRHSSKLITATGTIGLIRSGGSFTTQHVLGVDYPPATTATGSVFMEIFGNTNGTVNITADNYVVTSGTASFPTVPVFTIEKTNDEGTVIGPPLISNFNVINDPSKSFNSFLGGKVQIATTSSGTSGGRIYVKVDNKLFSYNNNIALGTEDGSGALVSTTDQIPAQGTNSLSWTHESGVGALPFLTYLEHDSNLNITHVKTIDHTSLLNTTSSKEVLLNISSYTASEFKVFYDQNDFDTLYFVDTGNNLRAFNLDDRLSAFMSLNADDVSLPAGTAQQTFVRAQVINAWGETLDGKTVTFAVIAGDGALTPATDVTVSGGHAESQFTVGATVGVSVISAVISES